MVEIEKPEVKEITQKQVELIDKLVNSSKLKLSEFKELHALFKDKIKTSYDGSILIDYLLSMFKFRRHFFNGRRGAYKRCAMCKGREDLFKLVNSEGLGSNWICRPCFVNSTGLSIQEEPETPEDEIDEAQECTADLHQKYDDSINEDSIDEDR